MTAKTAIGAGMTRPVDPPSVEEGTPVAGAVTTARAAFDRRDVARGDRAYQRAVSLAGPTGCALWVALAGEHVSELLTARRPTLAFARCTEYLRQCAMQGPDLLVRQAECLSALGRHAEAAALVADIRSTGLSREDDARLHRVSGLAAANARDLDRARHHLAGAEVIFDHLGNDAGVTRVHGDRRLIGVRQDEQSAIDGALADREPWTVAEHIERALALKRVQRYEEAIEVLRRAFTLEVDAAWRVDLLHQLILMYRLTAQHATASELLPLLRKAVDEADAGEAGAALLAEVSTVDSVDEESAELDGQVRRARRLITKKRLDEADAVLREIGAAVRTNREVAGWHLAAGELEFARGKRFRPALELAVDHLRAAVDMAAAPALAELRVVALRLLGQVLYRLESDDEAMRCWAEASHSEEGIARRQESDRVRVLMLESVGNVYDEWIDAAASVLLERGREHLAGLVVAMEAARGGTILDRILPGEAAALRNLPRPHDLDHAWRWIKAIVHGLPRSQVIWLMHGTRDRLHHVILGDGVVGWKSLACERDGLERSVKDLRAFCSDKGFLEASIESGDFDACLDDLAVRIGLDEVIPLLHPRIRRIAVVASGALSEIPLAGLRIPDCTRRIGHRYALSDLPCLSARLPLRHVSGIRRGRGRLRVVPPGNGLTHGIVRDRAPLLDAEATVENLRKRLGDGRYRQVRIDAHGEYDHGDTNRSWLALAPEGPAGHLEPDALQRLDLGGCGSLILGACESGMATVIGRDERVGFVRAGIHAGAASVVAARWKAPDLVAGPILDRYQRYVSYLPRDVALQRAISHAPLEETVPMPEHPARWACWTLYGDSGWDTGAGTIVRLARRAWMEGIRFAKPR
jgi:tetratricopeptide (TPR) repeat protein